MLLCHTCKKTKDETDFHKHPTNPRRHNYDCKECHAVYKKQYYLDNKDKHKANFIKNYCSPEGRLRYLLKRSRESAKNSGREHTITIDDLTWPKVCPYLGIPLTYETGKGQVGTNASIDRIDSAKGYVPGNVEIISRMANTMKSNATKEQLITFANSVLNRHLHDVT